MAAPRIVGFGGALGAVGSSSHALRLALEGAREAGADTVHIELRDLGLPLYEWRAAPPQAALDFAAAMHAADGLIWSSPLYHGSVSGAFKNAVDWLELLADRSPPYLTDKPVGLIAASAGAQSLQAINTMDFIVRALRGWVVPLAGPIGGAGRVFDERGDALEPRVDAQLRLLGAEVTRAARLLRGADRA